jgi:steroid 5-alpha reductase family enzyme
VTLVSPLFVYLLLTRVSGIPILEARADERWGDDPAYQDYKARTPVLMLRPPARSAAA